MSGWRTAIERLARGWRATAADVQVLQMSLVSGGWRATAGMARGWRSANERPARKLRLVATWQPVDSAQVAQLLNERLVRGSGWRQAGERLAIDSL